MPNKNQSQPAQRPGCLKGLEFYSANKILTDRNKLSDDLRTQMRDKVNLWSLAGQPIGGDIGRLQVDLDWLLALGLDGEAPVN